MTKIDSKPDMSAAAVIAAAAAEPPVEISTAVLMGRRRELTILHAGERYRLRITANDKLILTK